MPKSEVCRPVFSSSIEQCSIMECPVCGDTDIKAVPPNSPVGANYAVLTFACRAKHRFDLRIRRQSRQLKFSCKVYACES